MNYFKNSKELNDYLWEKGQKFFFNTNKNRLDCLFDSNKEPSDEEWNVIQKNFPQNGVYVMFDITEKDENGLPKVVRIGINREQDTLLKRLHSHYLGKKRKSIFRKHIGKCMPDWAEDNITKYIQDNIQFVIIKVDNKTDRENLEKMLISSFSNCSSSLSQNWLGRKHPNPKISQGHLWNIQGLKAESLNDSGEQLIFDGLMMDCDFDKSFFGD